MEGLFLLQDIILTQMLTRSIARNPSLLGTHNKRSSLVALINGLRELGSSDHNPRKHSPPHSASNRKARFTPKNRPTQRVSFHCRQGAILVVALQSSHTIKPDIGIFGRPQESVSNHRKRPHHHDTLLSGKSRNDVFNFARHDAQKA